MTISPSSVRELTGEEAIEAAKKFVAERAEDYPLMPLTECGDVDWEAYEPGCTPWNILEEFSILRAEVIEMVLDEPCITVQVEARYLWSESEGESETATYDVYVPLDFDPKTTKVDRHTFEYDIVA